MFADERHDVRGGPHTDDVLVKNGHDRTVPCRRIDGNQIWDRVRYLALDRTVRLEGAARFPVVRRLAARAGARFLAAGAFRAAVLRTAGALWAAALRAAALRTAPRFFVDAARFFDAAALRAGARLAGLRAGVRFLVTEGRRASLLSTTWAADSRAMGTRKGEQLT